MNTKNQWQTTAKILDPERRALWIKIFEDAIVPIVSFFPASVNLPGRPNARAYMLDLQAITDKQREGVIETIAKNFDVPIEEVRRDINAAGVPILADGVSVSSSDQGLFFSMIDDGSEP